MAVTRVGVVGLGGISSEHIEAYLAFPDRCRVVALADVMPQKCLHQAQKYGLEAQVFPSCTAMLEAAGLDLVSVCTPPSSHAEVTCDALSAGAHVLVEKPMAPSLQECDEMLAAAARAGRLLSVVAQNRFRTPVTRLKRVLDQGLAGRVLYAQVESFWWRALSYYDLWWRGTWGTEGGGCTFIHAVHHIDALHWVMGLPTEVTAVMANLAHTNSQVEDISCALLRFPQGSLGQVTSSVLHHGQRQRLTFQGERAAVYFPWGVDATRGRENGFPEEDAATKAEIERFAGSLPELAHEGHEGQVDNVLSAIEGAGEVLVDGGQGRRTMEIVLSIYKAAITGGPAHLPMVPDDLFYRRQGLARVAPHFYEKSASVEGFADQEISLMSELRP